MATCTPDLQRPADAHDFGSDGTEIKLQAVENYLQAYAIALKPRFEIIYFDGFAGTGSRTITHGAQEKALFWNAEPERIENLRGSARVALDIQPAFDRLIFMDQKKAHVGALERLKNEPEYQGRNIRVLHGDANELIAREIRRIVWRGRRAVMFLDPFGMQVDWETLKIIAGTGAIDVCYRFSLEGLYRNAARNLRAVCAQKRNALNRTLGTTGWEQRLYSPVEKPNSLFELEPSAERQRNADVAGLEAYVKERFETIFPAVLDPIPLPVVQRPQMASLFFMISNKSEKAISLARRFGDHIVRQAGSSSQVRSR